MLLSRAKSPFLFTTNSVLPESARLTGFVPPEGNGEPLIGSSAPFSSMSNTAIESEPEFTANNSVCSGIGYNFGVRIVRSQLSGTCPERPRLLSGTARLEQASGRRFHRAEKRKSSCHLRS